MGCRKNDGSWNYAWATYGTTTGDADGDGIPDNIDPYPNDNTAFNWRVKGGVKDEAGAWRQMVIETDRGDTFIMEDGTWMNGYRSGSNQGRSVINVCTGDCYTEDSSDYAALFQENTNLAQVDNTGTKTSELKDGERVVNPESGVSQGQKSATGDDEAVLLGKIADNTAAGLNNDQTASNQLKGIAQGIEGVREAVENIKPGGGGGGTSSTDVQSGVAGAMSSRDSAQQTQALSDNAESISAINGAEFTGPAEFTTEDVPEKETLTSTLNDWVSSGPLGSFLSGTHIELNGADCHYSFNLPIWSGLGTVIDFDFCQCAGPLSTAGVFLLALTGAACVFIVVKS